MKSSFYLSIFVLVLSILACGFPGSAPAAPTIEALPPTPNLPVAASPEPQIPAATVAPPAFSSTIRDEFDGKLSPGSGWTWLRQDPSGFSLTANPGWLRINLSTEGYLFGLPSNVLTLPAPQGDFDIRTLVQVSPSRNFEFAGLIVLFDEKSVLQLGRAFCDAPTCVGSGFYFDNLQNGAIVGNNFGTPSSSNLNLLRLVRQGNLYTAYHQIDNAAWVEIGSHTVDRQPVSVGLIAAQAPAGGVFAEFDWFEVNLP